MLLPGGDENAMRAKTPKIENRSSPAHNLDRSNRDLVHAFAFNAHERMACALSRGVSNRYYDGAETRLVPDFMACQLPPIPGGKRPVCSLFSEGTLGKGLRSRGDARVAADDRARRESPGSSRR